MFVQPYTDCPLDNELVGETVYLNLINNAKDYVYINQFTSLYNPLAYFDLCREIVKRFKTLDYCVVGIGSGGTIYTLSKVLKKCYPGIKIIGVLPKDNDLIDGIGANVNNHFSKLNNECIYVDRGCAIKQMKELNEAGIPIGLSSAACFKASLDIKKENPNSVILMIAHDGYDRYCDVIE